MARIPGNTDIIFCNRLNSLDYFSWGEGTSFCHKNWAKKSLSQHMRDMCAMTDGNAALMHSVHCRFAQSFYFGVLVFDLRALSLLSTCSTTWATPPPTCTAFWIVNCHHGATYLASLVINTLLLIFVCIRFYNHPEQL